MSFSHAKAKSLREASIRRGDIASPSEGLAPVGIGVSGGEEVGGSGGGVMDFLMPDGSVASMVDSEEEGDEMFSDYDGQQGTKRTMEGKKVPGAVKLLSPSLLETKGWMSNGTGMCVED
jgi:hypothetical protein